MSAQDRLGALQSHLGRDGGFRSGPKGIDPRLGGHP